MSLPSSRVRSPGATEASVLAGSAGILVLGMHRSGTSALARALNAMGAYAGAADELLPAHERDNPLGYWERRDVMLAHDHFLQSCGYAWDRVAGFTPAAIDAGAWDTLRSRLAPVVAAMRGASAPWLIKDPRLCLLLPAWLALEPQAACVVAVRDPREIVASLVDTHRGVYTTHFLLALWEKYTRTLLDGLGGRRALFVSYGALVAAPTVQCQRLQEGLVALGVRGLTADGAAMLERGLQRSRGAAHAQLSPSQAQLFEWLSAQAQAPGPVVAGGWPAADGPDAQLAEYQRAVDDAVRRSRAAAVGEFEQHLAQIEARLQHQENERVGWLSELAARREHNEQLLRAIDEAQQGNRQLQQGIADVNARAERVQEILDAERIQAGEVAAELARTAAALERSAAEVDQVRETLDTLQTTHEVLQADREQLQANHEVLQAAHETLRSEHHALRAEWAVLVTDRDELRAGLDASEQERQSLQATLARAVAERETFRTELTRHSDALSASVRDLQSSWSWRITAPLRLVGDALRYPLWKKTERWLWRAYYAMPGLDPARKRRLIVWLHARAPWLTRGTQSYDLYTRSQALTAPGGTNPAQRMDDARATALLSQLGTATRFSIILAVDNADAARLTAAIHSILRQFYPSWELLVVVSGAPAPPVQAALQAFTEQDLRIKLRTAKRSDGAAGLNAAVRAARGDYIVFVGADSELARDALLEFAQTIADQGPDLIYCDEDSITRDGRHAEPSFKPEFSLDYLLSTNFIGRCSAVRRDLLQGAGAFRSGFDGAEHYDMLLRVSEQGTRIAHIAKVLLHRHALDPRRAVGAGENPMANAIKALRESVARRGIDAEVGPGRLPETYRVRRRIHGSPLVSVLLPFRDKPDLLRTCVTSVLEKTRYANFELVGIDNGSVDEETHELMRALSARDARVRFIRHDVPFNYSAIVNFGVGHTHGDHLLMLNNDTEVIGAEWMEALLEHSQRPEVGAAGALLLYPNKSIQHGGVIVGLGGVAGHAHLMLGSTQPGYCGRAQVIQNLSAVTFACAMTRRDVFDRLGGLDSVHLTAAYNDIDYCLRLREAGYMIVYTPYAELFHHESASRPHDLHPAQRARYEAEIRYMKERHARILASGDPYYSPNLSLAEGFVPSLAYADTLPG